MDDYSTPHKMKRVGDLFLKYQTKIKAPQATVEKAVAVAIKKITGFEVAVDQVNYTVSTKTVSLKVSSVLKTELKLYQQQIIDELKIQLSEYEVPKVIL